MQPNSERVAASAAAPRAPAASAAAPRTPAASAAAPRAPSPSKGEATRARIIQHALELARHVGLESVSIGDLAQEVGISKSGLFAHFGSKERLLLDVLDVAAEHFTDRIFRPAVEQARGVPRLEALFENWLEQIHSRELPGGSCVFMAGAFEWDDRQGPVRERVVSHFRALHATLARAVQIAIDEKQFRADLDPEQFAHELHGILLQYHLEARLLRNHKATIHARRAFEHLLADARG